MTTEHTLMRALELAHKEIERLKGAQTAFALDAASLMHRASQPPREGEEVVIMHIRQNEAEQLKNHIDRGINLP